MVAANPPISYGVFPHLGLGGRRPSVTDLCMLRYRKMILGGAHKARAFAAP